MNDLQSQLPVELLRRIDAACDRFESTWRAGAMPRVEDFLPLFRSEERAPLLTALQSLQHELLLCQTTIPESEPNATTQAMPIINEPDAADVYFQEVEENEPPSDLPQDGMSAHVRFRVIAGPHSGAGFTFNEHNTLLPGDCRRHNFVLRKISIFLAIISGSK